MDLRSKMRARIPRNAGRWYEIKNQAGPRATVRIYSEIGFFGVTAEDLAAELDDISAPEIEVQINSPGGDVFDGLAIFNSLRAHPARVTTRVDGIAASAASVIAQAGDHRVMLSSSQMMIHEAWGLAIGPASEMREFADLLDQQNDVLAALYADRAGRDADEMRSLMAAETWLTDQAAVDAGLADEVVTPDRKGASSAATPAVTDESIRALIAAELDQRVGPTPSAGEREDPPTEQSVDPEQASGLLAALTITKETPHE